MRLFALARFKYGLLWKKSFPKFDWRLVIDGILFSALLIIVYAFISYMGSLAAANDSNARAVYRAEHAEKALVQCLNGNTIIASDNTAIFCKTITVKL